MKNLPFQSLFSSLSLTLLFQFITFAGYASTPIACKNPAFPGCQSPTRGALKIAIMIDESGSVTSADFDKTKKATEAFGHTLMAKAGKTGEIEMGIYAFSTATRPILRTTDVKQGGFKSKFQTAMNNFSSTRGGATIFVKALDFLAQEGDVDIVYFLTDGKINESGSINSRACKLKQQGTFIFAVVIGNGTGLSTQRIRELTGSRQLKGTINQIEQADWMVETYNGLNNCMIDLAKAVVDNTPPTINCPPKRRAVTDISPRKTGKATAFDNCGSQIDITHEDVVLKGDCDWQCELERTWTATDKLQNSSTCVQIIETSNNQQIEEGLKEGPLVLGFSSTTLTITEKDIKCLLKWMPYNGTRPSGLKRGQQKVNASCRPGSNPVDANGRITNPLLGEAIKLALYLRLHPEFGDKRLSTLSLSIPAIVKQNLARTPDINNLLEVTNKALGNLVMAPHLKDLLKVLKQVNAEVNLGE